MLLAHLSNPKPGHPSGGAERGGHGVVGRRGGAGRGGGAGRSKVGGCGAKSYAQRANFPPPRAQRASRGLFLRGICTRGRPRSAAWFVLRVRVPSFNIALFGFGGHLSESTPLRRISVTLKSNLNVLSKHPQTYRKVRTRVSPVAASGLKAWRE